MKKQFGKIVSLIITAAMIIACLPSTGAVFAAPAAQNGGIDLAADLAATLEPLPEGAVEVKDLLSNNTSTRDVNVDENGTKKTEASSNADNHIYYIGDYNISEIDKIEVKAVLRERTQTTPAPAQIKFAYEPIGAEDEVNTQYITDKNGDIRNAGKRIGLISGTTSYLADGAEKCDDYQGALWTINADGITVDSESYAAFPGGTATVDTSTCEALSAKGEGKVHLFLYATASKGRVVMDYVNVILEGGAPTAAPSSEPTAVPSVEPTATPSVEPPVSPSAEATTAPEDLYIPEGAIDVAKQPAKTGASTHDVSDINGEKHKVAYTTDNKYSWYLGDYDISQIESIEVRAGLVPKLDASPDPIYPTLKFSYMDIGEEETVDTAYIDTNDGTIRNGDHVIADVAGYTYPDNDANQLKGHEHTGAVFTLARDGVTVDEEGYKAIHPQGEAGKTASQNLTEKGTGSVHLFVYGTAQSCRITIEYVKINLKGGAPTAAPSTEPTSAPSEEPTPSPSTEPTAAPNTEATVTPSAESTATPSTKPTATPSAEPTVSPSAEATATPSTEPTATPGTGATLPPIPEGAVEVKDLLSNNTSTRDVNVDENGTKKTEASSNADNHIYYIGDYDISEIDKIEVKAVLRERSETTPAPAQIKFAYEPIGAEDEVNTQYITDKNGDIRNAGKRIGLISGTTSYLVDGAEKCDDYQGALWTVNADGITVDTESYAAFPGGTATVNTSACEALSVKGEGKVHLFLYATASKGRAVMDYVNVILKGGAPTPTPGGEATPAPGTDETPEPGTTPGTEATPTPGTNETPAPGATATPEAEATTTPEGEATATPGTGATLPPIPEGAVEVKDLLSNNTSTRDVNVDESGTKKTEASSNADNHIYYIGDYDISEIDRIEIKAVLRERGEDNPAQIKFAYEPIEAEGEVDAAYLTDNSGDIRSTKQRIGLISGTTSYLVDGAEKCDEYQGALWTINADGITVDSESYAAFPGGTATVDASACEALSAKGEGKVHLFLYATASKGRAVMDYVNVILKGGAPTPTPGGEATPAPGTDETPEPGTTPGTEATPTPGTNETPAPGATATPAITPTPGTETTPEPGTTAAPGGEATPTPGAGVTPTPGAKPTTPPAPSDSVFRVTIPGDRVPEDVKSIYVKRNVLDPNEEPTVVERSADGSFYVELEKGYSYAITGAKDEAGNDINIDKVASDLSITETTSSEDVTLVEKTTPDAFTVTLDPVPDPVLLAHGEAFDPAKAGTITVVVKNPSRITVTYNEETKGDFEFRPYGDDAVMVIYKGVAADNYIPIERASVVTELGVSVANPQGGSEMPVPQKSIPGRYTFDYQWYLIGAYGSRTPLAYGERADKGMTYDIEITFKADSGSTIAENAVYYLNSIKQWNVVDHMLTASFKTLGGGISIGGGGGSGGGGGGGFATAATAAPAENPGATAAPESPGPDISGPASGTVFADVPPTYWAYEYIMDLYDAGIINGETATTFLPENNITRAEFTKIAASVFGLKASSSASPFTDVGPDDWFASYVAAANEAGIVKGVSDTEFAPNDLITREQMSTIIGRYLNAASETLPPYTDSAEISDYAIPYVAGLTEKGFLEGDDTGAFRPLSNAQRAEAAALMDRVRKFLEPEPSLEPEVSEAPTE